MQAAIGRNAEQACRLIRTHIQTTSDNVAKYATGMIDPTDPSAGRRPAHCHKARLRSLRR